MPFLRNSELFLSPKGFAQKVLKYVSPVGAQASCLPTFERSVERIDIAYLQFEESIAHLDRRSSLPLERRQAGCLRSDFKSYRAALRSVRVSRTDVNALRKNVFPIRTKVFVLKKNVLLERINVFALQKNVFPLRMNVLPLRVNVLLLRVNVLLLRKKLLFSCTSVLNTGNYGRLRNTANTKLE
jgi:hypothetical protein